MNVEHVSKRASIYVRVSTENQANSGLGMEAQEAACRAYCLAHGFTVSKVFVDAGVSSVAPLESRAGLISAVDSLEEGDVLVVAKRDRIARDVVLAATAERIVEKSGATIQSADGLGNVVGPEGELMKSIVAAFAQYERALIRFRTKAAMEAKKRRGEPVGQPKLYECVENGKRIVVPEIVRMLRQIQRLNEGANLSAEGLAKYLNKTKYPHPRGSRWTRQIVRSVVAAELPEV